MNQTGSGVGVSFKRETLSPSAERSELKIRWNGAGRELQKNDGAERSAEWEVAEREQREISQTPGGGTPTPESTPLV